MAKMGRKEVMGIVAVVALVVASATTVEGAIALTEDDSPDKSAAHIVTLWLRPGAASDEELERTLLEISSPASERFRQYISHEDIEKMCQPVAGAHDAVREWARSTLGEGRHSVQLSKHGDFVHVKAPVALFEMAFGREFALYKRTGFRFKLSEEEMRDVPGAEAFIPSNLQKFVRAIFGLTDFYPTPSRASAASACHDFAGEQIDPNIIQKQYRATGRGNFSKGKHSQGVAAFEDAQFVPSDVAKFQKDYHLPSVPVSVIGPNNGGFFGEASLDTQYIFSSGGGVDTYFIAREQFDL
eukprot:g1914.t1